MRNDARPIGEKLRDIDEHVRQERGLHRDSPPSSEQRDRERTSNRTVEPQKGTSNEPTKRSHA
jgi:hypothetical protein